MEFDSGRVNVMVEQRSGRPSTFADLVQDVDAAVQADGFVIIAQFEIGFNLSRGTVWDIKEAIQCKRPGLLIKGLVVLLLYDNARPHSAAATVNFLNSWGFEISSHPP
jgi:hypothetical protein